MLKNLISKGIDEGADFCSVITTDMLVVKDSLSKMCVNDKYKCPGFGRSKSCPPNVEGPSLIRDLVKKSEYSISVRIDVPIDELMTEKRIEHMTSLHRIVSAIEKGAVEEGFKNSRGFAGGSCRELFCKEFDSCSFLEGYGCRNPDIARPSISGFGIDAGSLYDASGWHRERKGTEGDGSLSWIIGLVIIVR